MSLKRTLRSWRNEPYTFEGVFTLLLGLKIRLRRMNKRRAQTWKVWTFFKQFGHSIWFVTWNVPSVQWTKWKEERFNSWTDIKKARNQFHLKNSNKGIKFISISQIHLQFHSPLSLLISIYLFSFLLLYLLCYHCHSSARSVSIIIYPLDSWENETDSLKVNKTGEMKEETKMVS